MRHDELPPADDRRERARVQLEIATHPILVEQLEEPVLDALGIALESHRHALGLNPQDANTLFNTSQVLAGIAEAVANDDLPQQALGLLEEAVTMQNKCLEIQEAEYAETLDMEQKAQNIATQEGTEPSGAEGAAKPEAADTGDTSDGQWATIVEAVTLDTLADTALAQLSALTTFSDVLSSNPECVPASTLSGIDKHWSGLEHKLAILSSKLPERSQEIALARAKFLSALLEAGFRYGQIDGEAYNKGRDAAFTAAGLQLEGSAEALIANARSLLSFNSAVSDIRPADKQLAPLRWNALTAAIAGLNSASRVPGAGADPRDLASTHLLRGDASMALYTMGAPPTAHASAAAQGPQLLRNAEVYYRNAAKLSPDADDKDAAAFRSHIAATLQQRGEAGPGVEAAGAIVAGAAKGPQWAVEQLEEMAEEGGLLPASLFPA